MDVKSSIAAQAITAESVFVPVWDPLVRVSHWLMPPAVLVDRITDEPRWMYVWLGYLVAALLVLRVAWGFLGSEHARFADFVTGPRAVIDYLILPVSFASNRGSISGTAQPEGQW
jgi:cytochrome b